MGGLGRSPGPPGARGTARSAPTGPQPTISLGGLGRSPSTPLVEDPYAGVDLGGGVDVVQAQEGGAQHGAGRDHLGDRLGGLGRQEFADPVVELGMTGGKDTTPEEDGGLL